jgi:hypothetical protein
MVSVQVTSTYMFFVNSLYINYMSTSPSKPPTIPMCPYTERVYMYYLPYYNQHLFYTPICFIMLYMDYLDRYMIIKNL